MTIALQSFIDNLGNKSDNRLYIKNGTLQYDNKVSLLSRFAAKLGFGNAAMSNVSSFIRKNYHDCFEKAKTFENYEKITAFFLQYNQTRSINWKKAKKIKIKDAEKPEYVKNLFYRIKSSLTVIKNKESGDNLNKLFLYSHLLTSNSMSIILNSNENKQMFNELLELKNEVRSTFLPLKTDKTYKGKATIQSGNLSSNEQKILKKSLRKIQKCILTQYFRDRLKTDRKELDLIKKAYKDNFFLKEKSFLKSQIFHWEKKLANGKPIAIPKWYHCTKNSSIVDSILNTDILFMRQKNKAGAFVSNRPEIKKYGGYCIALSDKIEKTGTFLPETQGNINPIFFTDHAELIQSDEISQAHNFDPSFFIWIGFQKGQNTLDSNGIGKEGIPIQKIERIKNGTFDYYSDTSVSYIFSENDDQNLPRIGIQKRVQVLSCSQAMALVHLINLARPLTLPEDWKPLLQS